MRKTLIALLSILCVGTAVTGAACAKSGGEQLASAPVNGGFESADLSGWTVEYGNAFDDDCVSSDKTFTYDYDENHNKLPVNATGNWYLSGKGFDGRYSNARTGAIRSTEFVLPEDGVISMKLAGGALTTGKGEQAAFKSKEKLCYVGVYRASDDRLLAKQANDYFIEHTENYVNPDKYAAGVYNTDNFYEYRLDLSDYAGEKVYIRIVDNDDGYYYSYLSVDDIRVGEYAEAQTEGAFYTKTRDYVTEAEAPSEYEIKNGGFETGSLAGWTIVEGDAFSNDGVNAESVYWNENITYSRDGNYHYGKYRPSATGVMRSSEFVLGGSGYISWKLGGCSDNVKTYLRFMVKTDGDDFEAARFSNFKYNDGFQFPYVANGLRHLNMIQYYSDFSDYLGRTMYIEVVDNNDSGNDETCITLDSVKTYWEEKPVWYNSESYRATVSDDRDVMPDSKYQVKNGGFETGDLTDWVCVGGIGKVVGESDWLGNPYNKKGRFLFTGFNHIGGSENEMEYKTGTLTSSAFEVGGSGWITYLLGGGKDVSLCYMSIIDADTEAELARFYNGAFNDGSMSLYKADLSGFIGRNVKIKLTDNATTDWGLLVADSFVTYYPDAKSVPENAKTANDLRTLDYLGKDNIYQVNNGDFETGDLFGWKKTGGIGGISDETVWWNEKLPFDKDGEYFFNGWLGDEDLTGTVESSAFTLGGSGWITFKLGGGKNTNLCYIEIFDKTKGEVVAKYGNTAFKDNGIAMNDLNGSNLANMVQYKADLSEYMDDELVIRIVDNAPKGDWGLMFADSFITYYESEAGIAAEAILAQNLK